MLDSSIDGSRTLRLLAVPFDHAVAAAMLLAEEQELHHKSNALAIVLVSCGALTGLASCGKVPTAGPTASQVMDQAAQEPQRFNLVEIDQNVASVLGGRHSVDPGAYLESDSGRPPPLTIGIGDTVAVSIWQAVNGQPFAGQAGPGQGGGNVTIPEQVVGADGAISVPYAGHIQVAGQTPLEVQRTIEQRLAQQTAQPQAIVTVPKQRSDTVTVFGDEATAARVPLSAAGDRLLDVIAAAGGSKTPFYNTSIRLTRNGRTFVIRTKALISDPRLNIFAWPGDIITLEQTPNKFSVFGATSNNTEVPFDAERLDLAEAIAKAGGLQDQRADPAGVFLLRFESPAVVKALGIRNLADEAKGKSPVLYHLNLRRIDGYFLARRFPVKNHDLIYVANASLTELQKFFTLVGTITGPVIAGTVVTRGTGP